MMYSQVLNLKSLLKTKFHTWTQLTIASYTSVFLSIDQEKEKQAFRKIFMLENICVKVHPILSLMQKTNKNNQLKEYNNTTKWCLNMLSGDEQPHSSKKQMEEQMKEYVTILRWPWQSCICVATTRLTRNAHMELTREWWQQTVQCSLHQNQNLWENIDQRSNWIAWRHLILI